MENDNFRRFGSSCVGIGVYVVSSAASRFLHRSAAGGTTTGEGGGGSGRSNSTSANALRLRTRSFQAGSFENSLSLPVFKVIYVIKLVLQYLTNWIGRNHFSEPCKIRLLRKNRTKITK